MIIAKLSSTVTLINPNTLKPNIVIKTNEFEPLKSVYLPPLESLAVASHKNISIWYFKKIITKIGI